MSYAHPESNFNRILREAALARADETARYVTREAERQAARQVARQAVINAAPLSRFGRVFNIVGPLGRTLGRLASIEAQVAYTVGSGLYAGYSHLKKEKSYEDTLKSFKAGGYKVLSGSGEREFQPRGEEHLSKYTEIPPTPSPSASSKIKKIKQTIEEINPTPPRIPETAIRVTPPKVPDQPREPPQIIGKMPTPIQAPAPAPVSVSTPASTPAPVSPPISTSAPISTPAPTSTSQTVTQQESPSTRGMYMGSRPVRPIHGYRVPNNRPYNMVNWERGARAKALLMVQ